MEMTGDNVTEFRVNDSADTTFDERVRESQSRVLAIARSVLGNRQDAEEVAQDAFVQAYRRYASLRSKDKFRAWVSRIVFRLALNRRRSQLRRLERDTVWHDAERRRHDSVERSEAALELQKVQSAIEELPEKLRLVLMLCAVQDMRQEEVAAVLRIPVGTVRSRLHLARRALIERMSR